MSQFGFPLTTQSGSVASAQSVGRVARSSGNVRQPNHVLGDQIAGHEAEPRPGASEEWLAAIELWTLTAWESDPLR